MEGVQYRIGNEKLIRVLDGASQRLRSLLTKQGRPQGALRVAVIGGGPAGYTAALSVAALERAALLDSRLSDIASWIIDRKT